MDVNFLPVEVPVSERGSKLSLSELSKCWNISTEVLLRAISEGRLQSVAWVDQIEKVALKDSYECILDEVIEDCQNGIARPEMESDWGWQAVDRESVGWAIRCGRQYVADPLLYFGGAKPRFLNDLYISKSAADIFEEKYLGCYQQAVGSAAAKENVIVKRGDQWFFTFNQKQLPPMRHRIGFHHLSVLLRHPNQKISCVELTSLANPKASQPRAEIVAECDNVGESEVQIPKFDATARSQIDGKIFELEQKKSAGNFTIEDVEELDALKKYLQQDSALFGRSRLFSSSTERARVKVKNAIDDARATIQTISPDLAQHLQTIKTGRDCEYDVDEPIQWHFE